MQPEQSRALVQPQHWTAEKLPTRKVSEGSVTFKVVVVLPPWQGDNPERVTECCKTSWAWLGLGMGVFVARSSYYKGIFFLSRTGSKVRLCRTVWGCKLFRKPEKLIDQPQHVTSQLTGNYPFCYCSLPSRMGTGNRNTKIKPTIFKMRLSLTHGGHEGCGCCQDFLKCRFHLCCLCWMDAFAQLAASWAAQHLPAPPEPPGKAPPQPIAGPGHMSTPVSALDTAPCCCAFLVHHP